MENKNSENSFEFKTIADMDKERCNKVTGRIVMGRCICGGDTSIIRFFGNNGTMLYCCGDICYYRINKIYFDKDGK